MFVNKFFHGFLSIKNNTKYGGKHFYILYLYDMHMKKKSSRVVAKHTNHIKR